jgi:hypothetical protein
MTAVGNTEPIFSSGFHRQPSIGSLGQLPTLQHLPILASIDSYFRILYSQFRKARSHDGLFDRFLKRIESGVRRGLPDRLHPSGGPVLKMSKAIHGRIIAAGLAVYNAAMWRRLRILLVVLPFTALAGDFLFARLIDHDIQAEKKAKTPDPAILSWVRSMGWKG